MYILDTDHLSLIQRNGELGQRILAKIATIENISIAVTVITYIAAISLVHNATLLTCNQSDFGIIQELSIENWSIKSS